ncbi:MAG: hypothetical protein ACRCX2_07875 [Paraclostridium sp.]
MTIIKRVADVGINNGRTVPSVMMAVAEECGELAKEVRVKYMADCYKEGDEDGILGEGCDIIIATIDLMLLEGYTEADIDKVINKKINKWKEKAGGAKRIDLRSAKCCVECEHGVQMDESDVFCERFTIYSDVCQVCNYYDGGSK